MIEYNPILVANRIRKLREENGMDLTQFALALGYTNSHTQLIEKGLRGLEKVKNFIKISQLFDVPINFLLMDNLLIYTDKDKTNQLDDEVLVLLSSLSKEKLKTVNLLIQAYKKSIS